MGIDDESSHPELGSEVADGVTREHRVSFPRAGCGKSACPVRRAGTGNRVMPNRTEATTRKCRQQPPGDSNHRACSRLYSPHSLWIVRVVLQAKMKEG